MPRDPGMLNVERMKAKVVLVGDGGVGKTSLIRRFTLNQYDDKYIATLGTKVSKIQLEVPHEAARVYLDMTIFDIMGQKGFRDLVKETYFNGAQGYLAVCEVGKRESLLSLHEWIAAAVEQAGQIPGFVVVNKTDLPERTHAVRREDADNLARIYDASIAYASAKTGASVDEAFNALAVIIVERAFASAKAWSGRQDFRRRLLGLIAKRGTLGATRDLLFSEFKGLSLPDLEQQLHALEGDALVQIMYRGPADFTVLITPEGTRAAERS